MIAVSQSWDSWPGCFCCGDLLTQAEQKGCHCHVGFVHKIAAERQGMGWMQVEHKEMVRGQLGTEPEQHASRLAAVGLSQQQVRDFRKNLGEVSKVPLQLWSGRQSQWGIMKENRRASDEKHKVGVHKLQKTPGCTIQLCLPRQVLCVRTFYFIRRRKKDQQEHRKWVAYSKLWKWLLK